LERRDEENTSKEELGEGKREEEGEAGDHLCWLIFE
jgi:hypothetical protein